MLINSPKNSALNDSDVTDENIYHGRRSLLKKMGFIGAGTLLGNSIVNQASAGLFGDDEPTFATTALNYKKDTTNLALAKTPEQKVISHNNFYEFGAKKEQPAQLSQQFNVKPWQLSISGECDNLIILD